MVRSCLATYATAGGGLGALTSRSLQAGMYAQTARMLDMLARRQSRAAFVRQRTATYGNDDDGQRTKEHDALDNPVRPTKVSWVRCLFLLRTAEFSPENNFYPLSALVLAYNSADVILGHTRPQ